MLIAMSRINVKKLINLVHARPALWDQKHDDYNNKLHLKVLWEQIGEIMDCTAESCKLKWRSLRDVFRRELKKYQSRLNDPNIADKSLPRWFYFKELQFLIEHLTGLENIADSSHELAEEFFESQYVKSEPDLLDDEEITLEADDDLLLTLTEDNLQNGHDDDDDKSGKYFAHSSKTRPDCVLKISDSNQFGDSHFDKSIKYYRENSKRSLDSLRAYEERGKKRKLMEKIDRDNDSDYHFLMSLLPFLKAVPQRRKMFIRTKIQNVFCEEMEAEKDAN